MTVSSQTLATFPIVKEHKTDLTVGLHNSCVRTSENQMVGLGGLEPPTSPLSGVRSNHLSYRPVR